MTLVKIEKDFQRLEEKTLHFSLSQRVVNPVLQIDYESGKYCARLGAFLRRGGESVFCACPSLEHNWLCDGDRIKPLPFDAPEIIRKSLQGLDPFNLKYLSVLQLCRDGVCDIDVDFSSRVFEKANDRCLDCSLPEGGNELNAELYPYQQQGVAWMLNALDSLGGFILADEMGLGKTLQIIALFVYRQPTKESPALIVCPTTLLANWCREISRFAPSLTWVVHRGADRTGYYKDLMRSQVVITTYDTLVNDLSMLKGIEWSFLVCDEAQAAKNPESRRRVALAQLPRQFTIPVTGTPVENSLLDLWSLTDLAIPDLLGSKDNFSVVFPDSEQGAHDLSQITDTLILKRQVRHVADDLPTRTDVDFPIELDLESQQAYEQIRQDTLAEYGAAGHLVAVGQLAVYCAHPWLRLKNSSIYDCESETERVQDTEHPLFTPKIEVCVNLLVEAFKINRKVLIFAAYNHCGELIREAASQKKIPVGYWNSINGSTPQSERQSIVDRFSEYAGPGVLILNPKAAGTGLNITAATVVIHYTQNWNPALEMQASARAHRRGQELPVIVYRLYYQGTVEETMIERSQWKRELGDMAVPISSRDGKDLNRAISITPMQGIQI